MLHRPETLHGPNVCDFSVFRNRSADALPTHEFGEHVQGLLAPGAADVAGVREGHVPDGVPRPVRRLARLALHPCVDADGGGAGELHEHQRSRCEETHGCHACHSVRAGRGRARLQLHVSAQQCTPVTPRKQSSPAEIRMEKSCRQVSGAIIVIIRRYLVPRQRGGMKLPTLPYYAGAMVRAKKQPEYDVLQIKGKPD
eukprot:SAG11_NODE_196_length_12778_cov_6.887767_5_plen_198_part_00